MAGEKRGELVIRIYCIEKKTYIFSESKKIKRSLKKYL